MVHSICESYPKFGADAPHQTGVITRRKKWDLTWLTWPGDLTFGDLGWNFYTRCQIQLWAGTEKMVTLSPPHSKSRVNPRPDGGPWWFFDNSSNSVWNSALKFSVPLRASFLRILWKKFTLDHPRSKVIEVKLRSCSAVFVKKKKRCWRRRAVNLQYAIQYKRNKLEKR